MADFRGVLAWTDTLEHHSRIWLHGCPRLDNGCLECIRSPRDSYYFIYSRLMGTVFTGRISLVHSRIVFFFLGHNYLASKSILE